MSFTLADLRQAVQGRGSVMVERRSRNYYRITIYDSTGKLHAQATGLSEDEAADKAAQKLAGALTEAQRVQDWVESITDILEKK